MHLTYVVRQLQLLSVSCMLLTHYIINDFEARYSIFLKLGSIKTTDRSGRSTCLQQNAIFSLPLRLLGDGAMFFVFFLIFYQ